MPRGVYVRKPFTEEHKRKISEAHKGKSLSEEIRQKISEAQKRIGNKPPSFKGKHLSEETRKKLSETHKGKPSPMEGKHHSEETKKKMSIVMTGKPHSSKGKHYSKISIAAKGKQKFLGKHHSEEAKRKISEAEKGRPSPMKGKHYPKMSEVKRGNRSPNWKGGKSFEPYPPTFTKELKAAIRQRDNYTCAICGKYPAFDVHHIDYDKKNCEPENLITLCKNCHAKTNFNREYWKDYFNNLKRR
jgi:hypothetical protein